MKKLLVILMVLMSTSVFAEWQIDVDTDLMTDEKKVSLYSVPSESSGGYGNKILMFRKPQGDVLLNFDAVLDILRLGTTTE